MHTITRNGSIYYNLRIPSKAVASFGCMLRLRLGDDPEAAREVETRLSQRLEAIWESGGNNKIDLPALLVSCKPETQDLTRWAEDYIALKGIDLVPTRVAVQTFLSVVGDRDFQDYRREDVRALVAHLQDSRAFLPRAYPLQTLEMLFDAHCHAFRELRPTAATGYRNRDIQDRDQTNG